MPRPGGESDKLGNRYEALWTVQNLLDLLSGDAAALTPESFEESNGVEFVKILRDNSEEFHSAKRQRSGHGWRLSDLARPEKGRSVLGDLFEKVQRNPARKVVFVSATVHSEAYEIWDRSRKCKTATEFKQQLNTKTALHDDFTNYVLPLAGNDFERAFQFFCSFRLVPIGEDELRRESERLVRLLLYRVDGAEVNTAEVVLKLADYVCGSLGRRLTEPDLCAELQRHGYHLKDWSRDLNAFQAVARLNEQYLRYIRSDLILGRSIPREEADSIAEALRLDGAKLAQLVVGTAGGGKSCVVAQIVEALRHAAVPLIVLRMDNLPHLSTTRALGRELGLPDSPALVLAGIANGARAVLVVDQLDAMSVVSGRNAGLWQVFEELLEEVRGRPNVRLLLACREFDLRYDPRLAKLVRTEGPAQRVDLGLLSVETVKAVVTESDSDPQRLSSVEIELLQLPFHLYLFLQGDPNNPAPFGGPQELFARFWEAKRVRARTAEADFETVVGVLSDQLSRTESISSLEEALDVVADDAAVLVSENVLVLENRRYRFFHESFFDYAFARRFVGQGRDLVHFLAEECAEQHLFRRAQVRQILAYQRDRNRPGYLATLRALLRGSRIRFHLKKLSLDWLAQAVDPFEEEWGIVLPLLRDSQLQWAALNVFWGRLPWFDLLHRIRAITTLLADTDSDFVDRCVRAFTQKELMTRRSTEIAGILQAHRGGGEAWDRRFREVLRFGHFHHSDEMFALALGLQQDGLSDHEEDVLFSASLTDMATERPELAVEFLAGGLERLVSRSRAEGETNPFAGPEGERGCDLHFLYKTAECAPLAFANRIVPIVKDLVLRNARTAKCGGYYDEIWRILQSGGIDEFKDALLESVRRSLCEIARQKPDECNALLEGWDTLNHKTLRFLLLSAWLGNPERFAARAAAYCVANPLAFITGYDVFVGNGNELDGIILPLLKRISPLLDNPVHAKLEAAIHGFCAPHEKDRPQIRGYRELSLFQQLASDRISQSSRLRIEELERKFPEPKIPTRTGRRSPVSDESGFLPPPISTAVFGKMTQEQFIGACRRYDSIKSSPDGSAWELWTPIRRAAKAERRRFASFVLNMPDDILPVYFDAILSGVVDESIETEKAPDGKSDVVLPITPPLETELLMRAIERVHRLPDKPCGPAICRVADALANRPISVELVEIVGDYALNNEDPKNDVWATDAGGGTRFYGGDPLSAGINSARGSAADSFSRFLFAHPEMAERLLPYVKALAFDKSVAVRAVNIQALTALLNTHRDTAVELFLGTCMAGDALWAVDSVETFIYHAAVTHFTALRALLRRMLASVEKQARHAAARQISVASFRNAEAREDTQLVLNGDEECRRAAAETFARHAAYESLRDVCVQHLKQLFDDPSKRVREAATDWFRSREGVWTEWQCELLKAFGNSAAFVDGGAECMMNLENTPAALPREFLDLARRAVDLFEENRKTNSPHAFRFAYKLPALVIRFYEQTTDVENKRVCLDLLDRMLALAWGEAARELDSVDRG